MPKLNISSYQPGQKDILLLDTNILIHLFYPTTTNSYMKCYEELYAKASKMKLRLIIPAIQVSEFVNRCIRFQYDIYVKKEGLNKDTFDFKKHYRTTDDYRDSMKAILDIIKNDILKNFSVVNDQFDSINPDSILIYGFSYDFNDALLVQIAEKYNASIITNDVDFANYNTPQTIITTNRQLLLFS